MELLTIPFLLLAVLVALVLLIAVPVALYTASQRVFPKGTTPYEPWMWFCLGFLPPLAVALFAIYWAADVAASLRACGNLPPVVQPRTVRDNLAPVMQPSTAPKQEPRAVPSLRLRSGDTRADLLGVIVGLAAAAAIGLIAWYFLME